MLRGLGRPPASPGAAPRRGRRGREPERRSRRGGGTPSQLGDSSAAPCQRAGPGTEPARRCSCSVAAASQIWKGVKETLSGPTKDALMDDSNTPVSNLQLEPQDGYHPGDSVQKRVTHLPSVSDENENQVDEVRPEQLTSAMGKTEVSEQDSLNNNESCPASGQAAAAAGESWESAPQEGPGSEGREKTGAGDRSTRTRKDTLKKTSPGLVSTAGDTEAAEVNANDQSEAPRPLLHSLFSLLRGEVEQLDSRTFPLCLHQIAESYYQEEDYEKAMKFIQLERLYHEQLLANLSAIQEQWETKWKSVQHTVTPLRNSEKGFNGEDFERLAKFCTTHQDPLLSKHKIAALEKSLGRKCLPQLMVSEDSEEGGAAPKDPESDPCLGVETNKESQHKGEPQESRPGSDPMAGQTDSQRLLVTAGEDHREEPLCSTEALLELHTQCWETAGPDSSENAQEGDSRLQAAPTEDSSGVAKTESVAADPVVLPCSEPVIEPLTSPGCDPVPPVLISKGQYSQTQRKELHLPLEDASKALPLEPRESSELTEPQQPDLTEHDGSAPRGQTDTESILGEKKISDVSTLLPEVSMAPEEKGEEEDQVSKEAEDYLNSLLEGCVKETEDYLSYEDNQDEDSDLLQDLSPEEASYSLQESLPSDDSCLSLDDLAKRIEIAEVVPAEGLVSILKKRDDSVGTHSAQMQQKPSKRRVRFQEIDDNLDQDDGGSGSCILLLLLCIATVFLSVGGTALYCTFGDMESPVCTDFADNVDFYYTKLLQGMAELKHWIYLS